MTTPKTKKAATKVSAKKPSTASAPRAEKKTDKLIELLERERGASFPGRRIVAYFQPHTYSRLEAFQADFAASFADADVVRIGAVYAARETAAGADPTARIVGSMDHPDVAAVGDLAGAYANLRATLRPGDVLLTLGAGDGVIVGEQLLTTLQDIA